MYNYLFQRNFPLNTALFWTVRLLILGIFHSIWTLFGPVRLLNLRISMCSPLCTHYWENPLSKYFSEWEICWYLLQEKKLAPPSWIHNLQSIYYYVCTLWDVMYTMGCFHSILLFRSKLLSTSGDVSTLYYYSALYYYWFIWLLQIFPLYITGIILHCTIIQNK